LMIVTAISLGLSSCAHQQKHRRMADWRGYEPSYTYDYGYGDLPTYGDTYYYYDTVSAPKRTIKGDMEYYWYPRDPRDSRIRTRSVVTDGYGPYYYYSGGE